MPRRCDPWCPLLCLFSPCAHRRSPPSQRALAALLRPLGHTSAAWAGPRRHAGTASQAERVGRRQGVGGRSCGAQRGRGASGRASVAGRKACWWNRTVPPEPGRGLQERLGAVAARAIPGRNARLTRNGGGGARWRLTGGWPEPAALQTLLCYLRLLVEMRNLLVFWAPVPGSAHARMRVDSPCSVGRCAPDGSHALQPNGQRPTVRRDGIVGSAFGLN